MGLFPWSLLDGIHIIETIDLFYDGLDYTIRGNIPMVVIKRKLLPSLGQELRVLLNARGTASRRF